MIDLLVVQSFLRLLTRSLVAKGVLSQSEVIGLYDAWFQEVFALGAELEAAGDERHVDDILQMIHSLADEFTPK